MKGTPITDDAGHRFGTLLMWEPNVGKSFSLAFWSETGLDWWKVPTDGRLASGNACEEVKKGDVLRLDRVTWEVNRVERKIPPVCK